MLDVDHKGFLDASDIGAFWKAVQVRWLPRAHNT